MVDKRQTHDAERLGTAVAWRHGDREWRARPTRSRSNRPISDRLYDDHLAGRRPCRDVPGGTVDKFDSVIPGVARIARSALWTLLKGEELSTASLEAQQKLVPLFDLGREYRDFAKIERIVLETEIALLVHPSSIGKAYLDDAKRSLASIGAPSILGDLSERFITLIDALVVRWDEILAGQTRIENLAPSFAAAETEKDEDSALVGDDDRGLVALSNAPKQSWPHIASTYLLEFLRDRDRQKLAAISAIFLWLMAIAQDPFHLLAVVIFLLPLLACVMSRAAYDLR